MNHLKERIKEDSRESQALKELLTNRINDYVEEVLMPYFGNLICFVKECEILIEKENMTSLKAYESKLKLYEYRYSMKFRGFYFNYFGLCLKGHVNPLIKSFANDWKKSVELINQEIMRSFTNFKNGQTISQVL